MYSIEKLQSLEQQFGSLIYLFCEEDFVKNYREFVACFDKYYSKYQLAYSYKTNYTPTICKLVKSLGGYAEVVSDMEYSVARAIGYAPTQIGDLSAHYKFLTAMVDGSLKQLAVMGTMHEVGYWEGAIDENTPCNPISMYGIAKDALRRLMILYCKQKECILQWLRAYYILGDDKKNNSIFCKLLLAAEEGMKTFPFTTGKNQYDFITVDELENQLSAVVMQKEVVGIINCCTGKPMSLAERVEQFIKENNLDIKLEYGAFPDRPYDSPIEYGNNDRIARILYNEVNLKK